MDALNKFHRARSEVLDAFAHAEKKLVLFLKQYGSEPCCATSPLSQKLDHLKWVKPGPKLAKAKLKAVNEAVDIFRHALPLRADLVHSVLRVVEIDGPTALYVNAANCSSESLNGRLMTMVQHEALAKRANDFAEVFSPPSPRPPSPDATSGP